MINANLIQVGKNRFENLYERLLESYVNTGLLQPLVEERNSPMGSTMSKMRSTLPVEIEKSRISAEVKRQIEANPMSMKMKR